MRTKVFYVLLALTLLFSVGMALLGWQQPLTQQAAMTAFGVLVPLWIALNVAGGKQRGAVLMLTAIAVLASAMVWLIPTIQRYGMP